MLVSDYDPDIMIKNHSPWHPPFQQILVNHAHRVVLVDLGGLYLRLVLSHQIFPANNKNTQHTSRLIISDLTT